MSNGWVENPKGDSPGWWLWAGGDAGNETNWTQNPGSAPPDGFEPDARNPGWYFNGGNPEDPNDWWHDETITVPVSAFEAAEVQKVFPSVSLKDVQANWDL